LKNLYEERPLSPKILFGDIRVGAGHAPFVVAEVGINHNGELERALEMVHVAARAGCDAVKFQTFKAAEFVNDPSQMFTYRSQGREVTESMLAMFQRYELPVSAWPVIKEECQKAGILFFSTPQNRSDLDILLQLGVPAVKVGSDDFTNLPLLKSYASTGLPLILSTGMSDLAEAHQALEAVGALDGYPVILLVCTSQYPTPPEDANLARITTLRAAFPMVPIGFSDHTRGSLAAAMAVALGACFLEKHFTLSHELPGPDHWFSEEPEGLVDWVAGIRAAQTMMGSPLVRPTAIERGNKLEYQRRLVAARDIRCGEILDETALTLRRVAGGHGLPPGFMEYLLDRPSPRTYRAGEPIEL
jgi:N,N'-diacetyllegionaminate synthase